MDANPALALHFPFYPQLSIEGERSPQCDKILCLAIDRLLRLTPQGHPLYDWVHAVTYKFVDIPHGGLASRGLVRLRPNGLTEWTTVHELAHAWDASLGWLLSRQMQKATRSHFWFRWLHTLHPQNPRFWYHVGSPPPPCGIDRNFTEKEDFAEALTAYVFPEDAHCKAVKRNASYENCGYHHFHDTPRGIFIRQLIAKKTPS